MNIVIFGAGAIGSLFGGMLAKNNDVTYLGRKAHIEKIKKEGLQINGKTKFLAKPKAVTSVKDIKTKPDLIIIAVKSYDTKNAIKKASLLAGKNTFIMSLQNGLGNLEKIKKYTKKILICITTHGSFYDKPGQIIHTGVGDTKIGCINDKDINKTKEVINIFNRAGIKTHYSSDIKKEIWSKAVINSSINPLTSIFDCKNGYLLKNLILEKILEKICIESTIIANTQKFKLDEQDMIKKTKKVVNDTADNYSSMLQSIKKGKKTEIEEINGLLVKTAEKQNCDASLNSILVHMIKQL